jgi:hypothetical protein
MRQSEMSKRSKTKNSKATPAVILRPAVSTVPSEATTSQAQVTLAAEQPKPMLSNDTALAIRALEKNTTHASSAVIPNEQVVEMNLTVPLSSSEPASSQILDALKAVSAIPEKLATVAVASLEPEVATTIDEAKLQPTTDQAKTTTPWDYSAKLLSMGQANTLCLTNFAGRYAAAKTTQDILAITSDFYKEQGRLFNKHFEDIFKMLSL